jgi:hypothetical protein
VSAGTDATPATTDDAPTTPVVSGPHAIQHPVGRVGRLAAHVYALVDAAVILAPALTVRATGAQAGIGGAYSLDLLLASGSIAVVHGAIAARRLLNEERGAHRRADIWIASINALVVLALASTLLITVILVGFANQHAWLSNRGAPVVFLWGGVQLVAVVLAELSGRLVYRWLERAADEEDAELELTIRDGDAR